MVLSEVSREQTGMVLSSFPCFELYNSYHCRPNRHQNLVETLFFKYSFHFYSRLTCSIMIYQYIT